MQIPVSAARSKGAKSLLIWRGLWALLALAYAWPIASTGHERLLRVNEQARARLIVRHHLWESQADFRGRPEAWTRAAARLLTDGQLLRRVALKYGAAGEQIAIDYRRDLAVARAEVVLTWFALWAVPLAALYGIVAFARRRPSPRRPAPAPQPASASDPRYRPPQNTL